MFGLDLFGVKKRKEAKLVAEAKARSDERAAVAKRILELDTRNKRNAAELDARNLRYITAQRKTVSDRREDDRRCDYSPSPDLFWVNTIAMDTSGSYTPPSPSYDSGSSYTPSSSFSSSSSYDSGSSYSSSSSCDSSSSSSSCSSGGD